MSRPGLPSAPMMGYRVVCRVPPRMPLGSVMLMSKRPASVVVSVVWNTPALVASVAPR